MTQKTTYLIRNTALYGEQNVDILLADGVIAAIEPANTLTSVRENPTAIDIDGTNTVALPGLVDLHTHLREPGREDSETILTGTQAAAMGGFTCVHAMANTNPVSDTAGVVEQVWRIGADHGYAEVRPVGAVTVGLKGEQLAELNAMASSAAAVRVFSDDGLCVHDPVLMRRALEYVKSFDGVVAQHAQEPRLTEGALMHEGVVSAELGMTGWPAVAEESIIARDVLLTEHVDSRLHVCHLSTAGSVDVVRWAKSRGINVSAEVTPHHLILTDDKVRTFDAKYKVNPPLRSESDRDAVREGLRDGTIDIVATDHAPHPSEDKTCEWAVAAMGVPGLETALSIVQTTMMTGAANDLTWRDVARVLSERPAEIGRVTDQGRPLKVGEPANLLLWDYTIEAPVSNLDHATKGRFTPVEGEVLKGRTRATFLHGKATVLDGELVALAQGSRS